VPEHDWINGWPSGHRVALAHELVDKREIQNLLHMPIKMMLGNELLQRHGDEWAKCPLCANPS
jgi:hypothetical protein